MWFFCMYYLSVLFLNVSCISKSLGHQFHPNLKEMYFFWFPLFKNDFFLVSQSSPNVLHVMTSWKTITLVAVLEISILSHVLHQQMELAEWNNASEFKRHRNKSAQCSRWSSSPVRQTDECIELRRVMYERAAAGLCGFGFGFLCDMPFLYSLPYFLCSSHEEPASFLQSCGGRASSHLQLRSRLQRHPRRLCAELLLWLKGSAEDKTDPGSVHTQFVFGRTSWPSNIKSGSSSLV